MDILPISDSAMPAKDVFGSASMDQLLGDLSRLYDLVILDAPPVLPVADARILARKVDFTVVVARWRATPYQAISGALGLLASDGVEVGGVLLNQVDMAQQVRHGYGDIAYYFNNYRSYYLDAPGAHQSTDAA
jgi:Mrp family chromosome partitioning ATPase